jgi:hypothetical protein
MKENFFVYVNILYEICYWFWYLPSDPRAQYIFVSVET